MTKAKPSSQKTLLFYLVLSLLTALAIFIHFYQLSNVPYGLHIDEAGMGYDAYTLAHFGTDRYLNPHPVYLLNFGAGQSALYSYLVASLGHFLPFTPFTLRLPAAILGLAFIAAGTLIIKEIYGSKLALYAFFLLSIIPYFIMQSRFGLDCNLFLPLSTIALLLLLNGLKKNSRHYLILSGIVWGITLYSYALAYLIIPLFFLALFLYLRSTHTLSFSKITPLLLPTFILALPLIIFVFINTFSLPEIKTSYFTIPRLWLFRNSELSPFPRLQNLPTITTNILFGDWLDYNALPNYLTFYPLSIPFIILGFFLSLKLLISNLKHQRFSSATIIFLFFLAHIITALFLDGNGPNVNKLNGLYFSVFFFLIQALSFCLKKIRFPRLLLSLITIAYLFSFVSFFHYYFFIYPHAVYPQYLFQEPVSLSLLPETWQHTTHPIYFDAPYIYYLFGERPNPASLDYSALITKGTYQNLNFFLPSTLAATPAAYVVRETNSTFLHALKRANFTHYSTSGMYQIYLPPTPPT
jgi:4-amino-4-deoxy-L-arabinose transferase-like glycosyltransferase